MSTDKPPYSIGSTHCPGLSKLVEEAGEVQQVVGKIMGLGGFGQHWDGSDLRARLVEEMGDVMAACQFVAEANGLELRRVRERALVKLETFRRWHRGEP